MVLKTVTVIIFGWLQQYTDKKEHKIFLIYKEIQMGSVAQSYMTDGLLKYG
jgi:hypothetical protein